ncbi:gustatory receptor 173 [Tribolium castaneum]|uniref:Gustatory receptor n=1 Tax=Tribolium castaneum TaxID=7070 RepID=B8PUP3_TRICA|nr:gustatory receptor [Tribolium castaneum]EEZ99397.1 gustatory receptor 173 [Tribolium castaneum]
MFWEPQDLCELALPLLKIWKYTGLLHYELHGKINSPDRRFVFKSSYFTLLIACLILGNLVVYMYYFDVTKDLKSCIVFIQMISNTVQNLGMIYTSHQKKSEFGVLFSRLLKMEKLISRKFGNKFLYNDILKYFLRVVLPKYSVVILVFVLNALYLFGANCEDLIYGACFYVGWIFDLNSELLLTFFLITVHQLYKKFNTGVKNNTNLGLRDINRIHSTLHDVTIILKDVAQGFIFYKLIPDFTCSVVGLYYLFTNGVDNFLNTFEKFLDLVLSLLGIPSIIVSNLYLMYLFEKISQEANETLEIVHKNCYNQKAPKKIFYKDKEIFYLKTIIRPAEFSIFGLFDFNFPFFYSMIVAVTTYLVYLVQFRQMEHV